nr:hypothetical protein [Gemmatimonadota bacterium]NIU75883.1 hypothetical protein [Gammaproteobacteria bacterium]
MAALSAQVAQLTAALAASEAEHAVEGMGDAPLETPTLKAGYSGPEAFQQAFEAMLSGLRPPAGVRPLTGIREAYHILTGDYEMSGRFN